MTRESPLKDKVVLVVDDEPDVLETVADDLAERRLDVVADDEHHLAEPAAQRVEDAVVNDRLAVRADRVHLFQTAIAAAHAGGQH